MIFTGELNGYAITVSCWENQVVFRFDGTNKEFTSFKDLEKGVNAYDLALRKQFSNRTAYMKPSWRMGEQKDIETVEITSTDGKCAWIKRNGQREKVSLDSLYADQEALKAVMEHEEQMNATIRAQWEGLKRWEPQP